MKKLILLIFFGSFITGLHAQTLKVKHKSHSGTTATFAVNSTTNFGLPDESYFIERERYETIKANKPLKKKAIQPILMKPEPLKKVKTMPKKSKKSKRLRLFKKKKKKVSNSNEKKNNSTVLLAKVPNKSASYSNYLWLVLIGIAILMYHLPYRNTEQQT